MTNTSILAWVAVDTDLELETSEWLDALEDVVRHEGRARGTELLEALLERGRIEGLHPLGEQTTPFVNSIAPADEPDLPGDPELERRLRAIVCWNAMAMVLQANRESSELGGHIASYQSAATLYEVGFNHFWRAPTSESGGDLVFIQGHSAPGIYARAHLEGRLEEHRVRGFRREIG